MRRTALAAITIVLALTMAAGCGGQEAEAELTPPTTAAATETSSEPTTEPAPATTAADAQPSMSPSDFIVRIIERRAKGQHARVWEELHPTHKGKIPRSLYARCEDANESSWTLVGVNVLEVYDEPTTIPGTVNEVVSKAVTIEIGATVPLLEGTQKWTDTAHAVEVAGKWTWALTDADWQAYSKGECPPAD